MLGLEPMKYPAQELTSGDDSQGCRSPTMKRRRRVCFWDQRVMVFPQMSVTGQGTERGAASITVSVGHGL